MYGAGDQKLGRIASKGRAYGKQMRKKFLSQVPGMEDFINAVKKAVKQRGFLIGLDGRKLAVRSEHSALNTLLQSAGALVMKKALVICDERLRLLGYDPGEDYEFVVNCHDEWQIECRPEITEDVKRVSREAIVKAGEYFDFRIGFRWTVKPSPVKPGTTHIEREKCTPIKNTAGNVSPGQNRPSAPFVKKTRMIGQISFDLTQRLRF